ncbi:hypothetical protein OF83DRAFT_314623 [Amylostereum chailletii]|nr:hypothetical protein OF83DRAFT_314623 [Amylostereum chailletii]
MMDRCLNGKRSEPPGVELSAWLALLLPISILRPSPPGYAACNTRLMGVKNTRYVAVALSTRLLRPRQDDDSDGTIMAMNVDSSPYLSDSLTLLSPISSKFFFVFQRIHLLPILTSRVYFNPHGPIAVLSRERCPRRMQYACFLCILSRSPESPPHAHHSNEYNPCRIRTALRLLLLMPTTRGQRRARSSRCDVPSSTQLQLGIPPSAGGSDVREEPADPRVSRRACRSPRLDVDRRPVTSRSPNFWIVQGSSAQAECSWIRARAGARVGR